MLHEFRRIPQPPAGKGDILLFNADRLQDPSCAKCRKEKAVRSVVRIMTVSARPPADRLGLFG